MQNKEPIVYDLRTKETLSDIFIDNDGDTVIPVKNGDRVVLSPEVAEEVWRLIEKEHALEVVKQRIHIDGDEALAENVDWLAQTYIDTQNDLVEPLEAFICEMVLKEFDLQDMEE